MSLKKRNIFTRILIWRYKHISEHQFVLVLSIVVGFLAGLGTVVLKYITLLIQSILEDGVIKNVHYALYFIFPIVGVWLVFLLKKNFIKQPIGHGIPTTLYSIAKKSGIIERYKIFASLITAPITVGFGGSVGLQGPVVSTGAALGSNVTQLFRMNTKTRMLLIGCATAGAMSSMFKAPVAAIVFAIEIFSLDLVFASLVPLLLASIAAVITSYFFIGTDVLFSFVLKASWHVSDFLFYLFLGLGTGIASVYFSKMYFLITHFFDRFSNPYWKMGVAALPIGLLLYFFPPLYGEGYGLMNNLLNGNTAEALSGMGSRIDMSNVWVVSAILFVIAVFKAIAMTTTFAAGGVGGVFIPTLFMGSTLGNIFAKIINQVGFSVSESNFTLVGMTGLMAGVLHAPLTAIFLIAEITGGYELFVPLMLVATISYGLTRYFIKNSIYTAELAKRGELITNDRDKNALIMLEIDQVLETDFIVLHPDMTLGQMLKIGVAKSSRNLFPVLDREERFLGIVLLDDIRSVMFDQSIYDSTTVALFMKSAPDVIFYRDSMQTVMKKFKGTGAWNLPVIDSNKYVGFISKSKLLTAYRNKLIQVTST